MARGISMEQFHPTSYSDSPMPVYEKGAFFPLADCSLVVEKEERNGPDQPPALPHSIAYEALPLSAANPERAEDEHQQPQQHCRPHTSLRRSYTVTLASVLPSLRTAASRTGVQDRWGHMASVVLNELPNDPSRHYKPTNGPTSHQNLFLSVNRDPIFNNTSNADTEEIIDHDSDSDSVDANSESFDFTISRPIVRSSSIALAELQGFRNKRREEERHFAESFMNTYLVNLLPKNMQNHHSQSMHYSEPHSFIDTLTPSSFSASPCTPFKDPGIQSTWIRRKSSYDFHTNSAPDQDQPVDRNDALTTESTLLPARRESFSYDQADPRHTVTLVPTPTEHNDDFLFGPSLDSLNGNKNSKTHHFTTMFQQSLNAPAEEHPILREMLSLFEGSQARKAISPSDALTGCITDTTTIDGDQDSEESSVSSSYPPDVRSSSPIVTFIHPELQVCDFSDMISWNKITSGATFFTAKTLKNGSSENNGHEEYFDGIVSEDDMLLEKNYYDDCEYSSHNDGPSVSLNDHSLEQQPELEDQNNDDNDNAVDLLDRFLPSSSVNCNQTREARFYCSVHTDVESLLSSWSEKVSWTVSE